MTNMNQYDLMKAFQIEPVSSLPNEFNKISLNIAQHGGSGPNENDTTEFLNEKGLKEEGVVQLINDNRDQVVIDFNNGENVVRKTYSLLTDPTYSLLTDPEGGNVVEFILDGPFNEQRLLRQAQSADPLAALTDPPATLTDPPATLTDPPAAPTPLQAIRTIIGRDENKQITTKRPYLFPLTKEIFSFPSLYMWIRSDLWIDNDDNILRSYNRFKYQNNYNKHRDTLAIQKELSIKIPYEILSKYLDSIHLSSEQTNIKEEEYEVVINGIITLIEIRLGTIKNIIEKNQLIEKDNSTRDLVLRLKVKEEYMIRKKENESKLQTTISGDVLTLAFATLDKEEAERQNETEKERRKYYLGPKRQPP